MLLLACTSFPGAAAEPAAATFSSEQIDFFAHKVVPILQAHCFSCHGAEPKIQGGLRLTSRVTILEGGESGPAVSVDSPDESLLLEAIRYESFEMPPKGKLPQAQIEILTRWVSMGLPWSDEAAAAALKPHAVPKVDEKARQFWAFKPVAHPKVPEVQNKAWVRNLIDAFILAKLEARGFAPAPMADKPALLRRLHYAVTGLPPSPEEVDAFIADSSPDAYERRVDQLLASRHYGEHWGRHWLDLVRYAETNSFERDGPKPNAWKYRDYVIQALNEDKPYDQFIREQLAGDELEPVTRDGVVATGFYRLGLWDDEPADRELSYYDQLDDIVSTTGQAFLGLTIGCARCHDHKIDPFPQKDYYKFLAFFHGINSYGNGPEAQRIVESESATVGASSGALAAGVKIQPFRDDAGGSAKPTDEFSRKLVEIKQQIASIEESVGKNLVAGMRDDFAHVENRQRILEGQVGTTITSKEFARYCELVKEKDLLELSRPATAEAVLAVIERGHEPRETFVLARGNPAGKEDMVQPGFPSVLGPAAAIDPAIPAAPQGSLSAGRRKIVADWIADRDNPLTSRVIVNRLWQYNFGRGLVRSSSNFGYMGTPPTHPELLDWLAGELAANRMRLKPLQRMLLTSNAFRMSSKADPAVAEQDPENDLISHFDLRRLSAEEIRDSILAVCGNLNLSKSGGPSVYPPIPREVLAGQSMPGSGWGKSTPEEQASRSVFVFVKRSLAVPLLASFDAPDPDGPCPVRFTTTQPSQALGLLNSQFLAEQSQLLAENLQQVAGPDPTAQVRLALRRTLQRMPTDAEVDRGLKFIVQLQDEEKLSPKVALSRFCLLAINLNEFVFLN